MKVYSDGELIVSVLLDFAYIDFNNIIDSGDSVMIPYNDREFLLRIKPLYDYAVRKMSLSWKIPDYNKCSAYFYIVDEDIDLIVEVFPRQFIADEKNEMLLNASMKKRKDGFSDYLELKCMFDDIDHILNSPRSVGEFYIFHLELNGQETMLFRSFMD